MEAYRSGRNELDSKSRRWISSPMPESQETSGFQPKQPNEKSWNANKLLTKENLLKIWKYFNTLIRKRIEEVATSCTRNHVICAKNWIFSKWRRIEAVITSSTRNRVVRKGTWVRIPPSPPTTIPRKSRVYAGFLMPFSEWFCPAENRQIRVNGARGAPICGALRQNSYTSYS